MRDFFLSGGYPMFVVLALGLVAIVAAVGFARSPDKRRGKVVGCLNQATGYSALMGVLTCLATVFSKVPNNPEWAKSPDLPLIVMMGLSESLSPGILGLALMTVVVVVSAVGHRRMAAAA